MILLRILARTTVRFNPLISYLLCASGSVGGPRP
jgi:hypothetical protein